MSKNTIKAILRVTAAQNSSLQVNSQASSVVTERGVICSTYQWQHVAKNIFKEMLDFMSEDANSTIFVVANWTNSLDILFKESEDMLRQSKSLQEGGFINYLAARIVESEGEGSLSIKIVDALTQMNLMNDLALLDKGGFLHLGSMVQFIELFSLVSQRLSNSTLVVSLKGNATQYRIVYFPLQQKQIAYQYCYNLEAQRQTLLDDFKIRQPRFCFFFNVLESALAQATQLVNALQDSKENPAAIENAKREMQKLQGNYKRLNEKYRKILSILGKCIDLQSTQIDKKSLLYVDYIPTMEKPNDKLKISAIRKAENEEEIQRLQKEVASLEGQINSIKEQHRQKMNLHQNKLAQKLQHKNKLWSIYQTYTNPKVKIDHTNNHNLYWKPTPFKPQRQSDPECIINQTVTCITKNNINSYKNITKPNIQIKAKDKKKTINFKSPDNAAPLLESTYNRKQRVKQEQMKLQIKSLFMLISQQEAFIQQAFKSSAHMVSNSTINQIKNRKAELKLNQSVIYQCLKNQHGVSNYENWMKQQSNFDKFQKQLKQKQLAAQTITTIREI